MTSVTFATPLLATAFFSARPLTNVQPRSRHIRIHPKATLLSVPFPLADPFAFPTISFPPSIATSDYRPELLGSVLWTIGLYFGFSQKERWGSTLQSALTATLTPLPAAEYISISLHTLPFLATGFLIDALLRHFNGGNAVWAVASGVTIAMYAGVYELGRSSARDKQVQEEEVAQYALFRDFAQRKLKPRGMCHLIDIRQAVREDARARQLSQLSDETIRRFVRNAFPSARRSRNGFYRGVSIRQDGK